MTYSQGENGAGIGVGCLVHRGSDRGLAIDHGGSAERVSRLIGSIVHLRRFVELFCHVILLIAVTGCCCARSDRLQSPSIAKPATASCWYDWMIGSDGIGQGSVDDFEVARLQASIQPTAHTSVALGEHAYSLAERFHADGDERAVDYWARTIAWMDDARRRSCDSSCPQTHYQRTHCQRTHGAKCSDCNDQICRTERVRDSAMIRILSCGQSYGRLDPSSYLLINGSARTFRIPVAHQGFAWQPNDFQRLLVFEPPAGALGNVCGRGVPLVVLTAKEPSEQSVCSSCDGRCGGDSSEIECDSFVDSRIPFAATALIQLPVTLFQETISAGDDSMSGTEAASVSLVNPLTIDPVDGCDGIAQSPAMPLLYARQASQYNPIVAFVNGDNGIDRPELRIS